MRLPFVILSCLLFAATGKAQEITHAELKQQILYELRILHLQRLQESGLRWTESGKLLNLHYEHEQMPIPQVLRDEGLPLGTTPFNYRMQLDSRQLGMELRYEF